MENIILNKWSMLSGRDHPLTSHMMLGLNSPGLHTCPIRPVFNLWGQYEVFRLCVRHKSAFADFKCPACVDLLLNTFAFPPAILSLLDVQHVSSMHV